MQRAVGVSDAVQQQGVLGGMRGVYGSAVKRLNQQGQVKHTETCRVFYERVCSAESRDAMV